MPTPHPRPFPVFLWCELHRVRALISLHHQMATRFVRPASPPLFGLASIFTGCRGFTRFSTKKWCVSSDGFARSLVLDLPAVVPRRVVESTHPTLACALNSMECKALTTFLGEMDPSPLLLSLPPPFGAAGGSHGEQGVRVMKLRE